MAAVLSDYLDDVARRRFAYGELDCCTLMADWLMRLGWPDAMADMRGRYANEREYRALMRGEGGIRASCARRFAHLGLQRRAARPGDVCLVQAPVKLRNGCVWHTATGAIAVTDRHRAMITPDAGLVVAELVTVRGWGAADA